MSTNTWRRFLGLLLPLASLLGMFCMPASAGGSRHPYFNDRGTLSWHHSLTSAQNAARRSNKVVFIEYGRKKCTNCRKLAQDVLPHRDIRGRLANTAVGLAAECDTPERAVWQLFRTHMPKGRMLPFAAFVTADGQWITGWYGRKSVREVSAYLASAERFVRTMRRAPSARRSASRSASRSAPRSAPRPTARRVAKAPTAPRSVKRKVIAQKPEIREVPAPAPRSTSKSAVRRDPCADASDESCPGGNCKPPSFDLPCLPNPFKLLAGGCKPACKPVCPPASPPRCPPTKGQVVAKTNGYGGFPPPKPRIDAPRKLLAGGSPDGEPTRGTDNTIPPPAAPAVPPTAAAAAGIALPPAVLPPAVLPPAALRTVPLAPTGALPTSRDIGSPDGQGSPDGKPAVRSAEELRVAERRAKIAALRGDWAAVLQLTRGSTKAQKGLHALNLQAHRWAHDRLAYAVRAVKDGQFVAARNAVAEVKLAMRGEAEAVDAARGGEAIELMRDLDFLAAKSPVRRTVRKTAFEKMRGTRWAPLFSESQPAGAALSSR